MSTQNNLDVSVWEKFTDGLSAMSEGIVGFLGRLFGSSNERIVRSLGYIRPKGSETHAVSPRFGAGSASTELEPADARASATMSSKS